MQPYDILMLVVLGLSMAFGAWKGMAWQIAALASLIVSFIVASRCSGALAPFFGAQEPWNRFIAMLVLYLLTSLAIWLAFRFVASFLDRVKLKEFDRQAGALFGLAKGVCWCILITFFAVTLSESTRKSVLGTYSGYYIAKLTHKATPILPAEVQKVLGHYIEEFQKKLRPDDPKADDPKPGDPNAKPDDPPDEPDNVPRDRVEDGPLADDVAWPGDTKAALAKDLSGATSSLASSLRSKVDRAEGYLKSKVRKKLSESGDSDTGAVVGAAIGTAIDSWIDRLGEADEKDGAGGATTTAPTPNEAGGGNVPQPAHDYLFGPPADNVQ